MERSGVNVPALVLLLLLAVSSAGCEVVEGIFKAGMFVGIIMVAIVVFAIIWIVGKIRG